MIPSFVHYSFETHTLLDNNMVSFHEYLWTTVLSMVRLNILPRILGSLKMLSYKVWHTLRAQLNHTSLVSLL